MVPDSFAKRAARASCALFVLFGGCAVACSGDDEVTTGGKPGAKQDAGIVPVGGAGGTSAGGDSGSGGGSNGASGDGGNGGVSGTSGFGGNSGNSGVGGVGGSGTDASVGGAGGGPTCNPAFCPNMGAGTPCCAGPNGPCGMNVGQGCISNPNPGRDR